jgi:ribulose kinase
MESVAYGMRNVIENMSAEKLNIHNIMACGGVTKNPLWLQIISDVCGKAINLTTRSSEAGILGCCIVAAAGAGVYSRFEDATRAMVRKNEVIRPDQKAHEEYKTLFEDYITLYQQLKPMMHKGKKYPIRPAD